MWKRGIYLKKPDITTKKPPVQRLVVLVGVERLELSASASRTQRATNCAIPRLITRAATIRCCSFVWLGKKDSNPHKQSQSLSCYPYTIPQYFVSARHCRPAAFYIISTFYLFVNTFFEKVSFIGMLLEMQQKSPKKR